MLIAVDAMYFFIFNRNFDSVLGKKYAINIFLVHFIYFVDTLIIIVFLYSNGVFLRSGILSAKSQKNLELKNPLLS